MKFKEGDKVIGNVTKSIYKVLNTYTNFLGVKCLKVIMLEPKGHNADFNSSKAGTIHNLGYDAVSLYKRGKVRHPLTDIFC